MTTIWIPGIPAPQGSKRHVGNGILIESSKKVGPWRAVVAITVGEQTTTVLDGPVRIELEFVMPRPKATPKRRSTPPAVKKPDLDKLTRAVLDAITGVSYRDDSQVVDLVASKRIAELGEPPGLSLTVEGAFCHCGGRAEIAGMCSPCKYSAHETCPCSHPQGDTMTDQLVFPTSPPTWCWICRRARQIKPAGCGPECEEDQ